MLSKDFLYGTLSTGVHDMVFNHILVSDMADKAYKEFFQQLSKLFSQPIVEYSEVDASTYDDKDDPLMMTSQQAATDGDIRG